MIVCPGEPLRENHHVLLTEGYLEPAERCSRSENSGPAIRNGACVVGCDVYVRAGFEDWDQDEVPNQIFT